MKYLIAWKFTHISNSYILLHDNHFGSWKYKNILDALVVVQEKIH